MSKESFMDELRNVKNLNESEQHVELAIVDATGRLQIPRGYLDKIGIKGRSRLRVEMEGERVVIYNPKESGEDAGSGEAG